MKLVVFFCLFLSLAPLNAIHAQSNCTPISDIKFPGGRVILSFDGNVHDDDDIIALPFAAALWWAAGLRDKVVQIEYNNHVCMFNGQENDNYGPGAGDDSENMRISVNGSISRFDYDPNVFYDIETQANLARNKMAEEIEKSTENDPLWILAGGPMETIYRGMNRATTGHDHVTIISHGIFNQDHGHCNGRKWSDLKNKFLSKGTYFVGHCRNNCDSPNELPTQNGGFNSSNGAFDWMNNHPDEKLDWVYSRNPFRDKVDPSDAGMSYFLITGGPFNGGEKRGNARDAKRLLENPCPNTTLSDNDVSHDKPSINVYPNPSIDYIEITLNNVANNAIIFIYDASGKTRSILSNSEREKIYLNIKNFSSGMYFIKVIDTYKNNIHSSKFIVM